VEGVHSRIEDAGQGQRESVQSRIEDAGWGWRVY
jgi:hypothetical protein